MQKPNGAQSFPLRSLAGFGLGLFLLGAVIAWPEAALANSITNPYWDDTAKEGDLVDVCDWLEVDDTGELSGECNKVNTKTDTGVMVVYDQVDLQPEFDSGCLNELELSAAADGIKLSFECIVSASDGAKDAGVDVVTLVKKIKKKLDDLVGWNTETGQFHR